MDQPTQSYRNRLLQLLPRSDFDALHPHLKAVTLEYRQPLFEANQPLRSVYFPVTGVASLVNTMADGSASEVGTIGNEGIVGLPILLGDELTPMSAYVQVPGTGLHLRAEILRSALQRSAGMRTVMLHYAHAFFDQVAQSAACNHFHPIEQRCCRWLLMTHDRVQSDQFLLTQEFLGMMLADRCRSSIAKSSKVVRANAMPSASGNSTGYQALPPAHMPECSKVCLRVSK